MKEWEKVVDNYLDKLEKLLGVNHFDWVIHYKPYNGFECYDTWEMSQILNNRVSLNLYELVCIDDNAKPEDFDIYAFVWVVENGVPLHKPIALLNKDNQTWTRL